MDELWGVTKELTGLGELEACLDNKDFDSCSGLATDVLIGAKLKALDRAFDSLKLLKRGCKILSKSAVSGTSAVGGPAARSTAVSGSTAVGGSVVALAADVPCVEHNVPGFPRDKSKITNGPGDCKACAEQIRDSLGGGEIIRFEKPGNFFGDYREQYNTWDHHYVVVRDGRVYDAFTPKGGETIAKYKSEWLYGDIINFGF